jgi:hypothetical protein
LEPLGKGVLNLQEVQHPIDYKTIDLELQITYFVLKAALDFEVLTAFFFVTYIVKA